MHIRFEWDEKNATDHYRKHKVSFEIAARVFADPKERKRYDQENR
jgi:uncharacterized protein